MAQDERTVGDLIALVKSYSPASDCSVIERAYEFAKEAHEGQNRVSGEAYITHPLEIAFILAGMQMDVTTITAGLLHDVVEDTKYTEEDLRGLFGEEVARLVEGVTKIEKLTYIDKEDQAIETFRKMFVAMAKDIRVVLIKLADRLHNMRTLGVMEVGKQRVKSQEVLDIFAPIAHRLGIFFMKSEFEDLALRYLQPEAYEDLTKKVAQKLSERQSLVNSLIDVLKEKLTREGIACEVTGRPKNFYSIYNKMLSGHSFEEIFDLTAIRVLVNTVSDCYAVLGWVHDLWKPINGRFKDYIAMPKSNRYQSLHTTVIGPGGSPFEIQIRTWEMHRTAEYGIAAHWKYKEGAAPGSNDSLTEMLRNLLDVFKNEEDLDDSKDYIEAVKQDLHPDEIFVFTPKGRTIELPAGSTPIDFAYRIHSDIGDKCVGARVNSRMVPLTTKLAIGDQVEIITNPNSKGPSRDWLKIAVSSGAKSKIRAFFRKADKNENIQKGKTLLEKEISSQHLEPADIIKDKYEDFIFRRFKVASWDDLFAIIGYGGLRPQFVVQRVKEQFRNDFPAPDREPSLTAAPKTKDRAIQIEGQEGMAFKLAKCCTPVPGDSIIGYITRGRGVSVHRADCVNIVNNDDARRLVSVAWGGQRSEKDRFVVVIIIRAVDRPRLLSDISTLIGNDGINISSITSRTTSDMVHISIDLIVREISQVETLLRRISAVPSVLSAQRS